MCGINFILDKTGKLEGTEIGKMNSAIRHRGPDHTATAALGIYKKTVFFGANRLRIVDQDKASDQPMFTDDDNHVITFSGEIYNFRELKKNLTKKGIKFHTGSDTETLLWHLAQFGEKGLTHLNGMFSFVFLDRKKAKLIAARDRHGMKPLFYADTPGALLISSETRGIIHSGLINADIADEGIDDYLKYRYVRHPNTIFRNIRQLGPGQCLIYSFKNDELIFTPFIRNPDELFEGNDEDLIRETENRLAASLRNHVSADKTPGLMLSGGVDSSLLLAILHDRGLTLPYTFSVINRREELSYGTSDFKYSSWVADKLEIRNHHPVEAGKEVLHKLPDMVSELDMPVGDPAFIVTSILSEEAGKHVGILLSGAGADEYFGGYNRHRAFKYYLQYYPLLKKITKFRPLLYNLLPDGRPHVLRKQFRLIRKFLRDLDPDPAMTYDNFMASGKSLFRSDMLTRSRAPLAKWDMDYFLSSAFERDRKEYLINDILLMSDQIALYHGIELRSPYLDNGLVDLLSGISPHAVLKHGRKWILKRLLTKYGLNKVAGRSKEGFGMPFGQWIRHGEFDYLRSNLTDKGNHLFGFIDREHTVKLVNDHMAYKEDNSFVIFSLMVLSEWLKRR